MRLPHPRPGLAGGLILAVAMIGAAMPDRAGLPRSFAAEPPSPPAYIPTPVGQPPEPPTPSPSATVPPTATSGIPVTSVSPTPTTVPTITPAAEVVFSVDAVRVSKVNNPGNLQGLETVKRGSNVWLMVYFTVDRLPRQVKRVTSYSINRNGRTVFRVIYSSAQRRSDLGRFSRYVSYRIPSTLPYGRYSLHIVLTMRGVTHSKSWRFSVGNRARWAAAHSGP